jgi:hypothetical protein
VLSFDAHKAAAIGPSENLLNRDERPEDQVLGTVVALCAHQLRETQTGSHPAAGATKIIDRQMILDSHWVESSDSQQTPLQNNKKGTH